MNVVLILQTFEGKPSNGKRKQKWFLTTFFTVVCSIVARVPDGVCVCGPGPPARLLARRCTCDLHFASDSWKLSWGGPVCVCVCLCGSRVGVGCCLTKRSGHGDSVGYTGIVKDLLWYGWHSNWHSGNRNSLFMAHNHLNWWRYLQSVKFYRKFKNCL